MPNLPCTTVAGRHAADARRTRAYAGLLERQDAAREQLVHELRSYGLVTYPHLQPELGVDRSIWVECRVASCANDRAFVYAILDELHWQPDTTRLSRFRQSYEVVRLRHADTGAAVVLIVKIPFGVPEPLEAA